MNLLVLDAAACGLDFCLRCIAAGHHVRLCIAYDKHTKQRSKVGDGLVEKIEQENFEPSMKWADLIVTTENTKWLNRLGVYRARGFPLFSPSFDSAQLELDRNRGQEFLKKNGIQTIPYEMFSDYSKAIKYLKENRRQLVSKPNGDRDKALSYVSKSPKDMLFMLDWWKSRNKDVGRFMLQEFVDGTEFAVNGWLGKNGFSAWIEESFEHKKFMPGDLGQNTGEQGTALKYVNNSALANEVLLPLQDELIKLGHTGSINISVIVDDDGVPWPMEFTVRMGWPAFDIVQPLHPDPCEWMLDLLDGNDTFMPKTETAVGVVMSIPPWPMDKLVVKDVTGIPIYGLDNDNPYREFLSPCEVMDGMAPNDDLEMERCIVSAGAYLVVATGIGDTVRSARDEAYSAVDSLEIPKDLQYRYDIGDRVRKALPRLQSHGFAKDWEF